MHIWLRDIVKFHTNSTYSHTHISIGNAQSHSAHSIWWMKRFTMKQGWAIAQCIWKKDGKCQSKRAQRIYTQNVWLKLYSHRNLFFSLLVLSRTHTVALRFTHWALSNKGCSCESVRSTWWTWKIQLYLVKFAMWFIIISYLNVKRNRIWFHLFQFS